MPVILTTAAAQAFQRERIESIENSRDSAPAAARGPLTERIQALETELEAGVIGEATIAQFEQLDNDATIRGEKDLELGIGSRGGDVVSLQNDLDEAGFFPGIADGIFGPNTSAATNAFQQERIDSLEATLEGGPPPAARSVITTQLQNLRDEQARNIAGEETQAQLAQRVAPAPEDNSGADATDGSPESPSNASDDLDVPETQEVQSTLDSVLAGDIDEALENGLNSDGDSVSINLGASVKAPAGIVGVEGEVSAEITRVEDGYEVSLSAEAAVSLGLAADSDDLGVGADIGAGATVVYHYDSLEQAKQGVSDLVITAGKHDAVQLAVDLAAESAALSNTIVDKVGDIVDGFPGPIGTAIRAATGGVDKLADSIIETVPEELNIDLPFPFGSVNIPLGTVKDDLQDDLQELDALRARAEQNLDGIRDAQSDARDRLNDAYSGFEVTGSAGAFADIGIPNPTQIENFGASVEGRVEHTVTGRFNADGTAEVDYSYTASGSGRAGLGIGGEISAETGITISQELRQDGLSFSTVGDVGVEFRADAEALAKLGVGVSYDQGVGGELVYATTANALGDQLGIAGQHFLEGDFDGTFEAIGDIEGDLEVTGRAVSGASLKLGGDVGGAELAVDGNIRFEDLGQTQSIDDLTLEEAFDFLTDQVEDAYDDFQPRTA